MKADYQGALEALLLDKESQQVLVTLKQLEMEWKAEDAENGAYTEVYKDAYSGNEINLTLNGTDTATVGYIPYGKYEIIVDGGSSLSLDRLEELGTKNAVFSYEDGRYYVTYSYQYEEAREDLQADMTADTWRGYTSEYSIANFFQPASVKTE
jgi:hypothetical protein